MGAEPEPPAPVFHVEVRQGLHQGRAFNLTRAELASRFVGPWLAGRELVLDERRYERERAKLRVLRGPRLPPEEIGLGRGWQNAERQAEDVTAEVLREPPSRGAATGELAEFKLAVEGACALEPRRLGEIVELAALRHPGSRVSEQLGLAEQAVWELLHEGRVELRAGGETLPGERWAEVVLAWASWRAEDGTGAVTIFRAAP